jgi:hypothetical protein
MLGGDNYYNCDLLTFEPSFWALPWVVPCDAIMITVAVNEMK